MKLTVNQVLETIVSALELESNTITLSSSMDDIEEWDSIGHLGILTKLDEALGGKAAGLRGLAEANNVENLLNELRAASLLED